MKKGLVVILIILLGLIMTDVTSDGKKRIISQDGKIKIPVSSSEINMKLPIGGEDRLIISNDEFSLNAPVAGEERLQINADGVKLSQPGNEVDVATDKQSIINSTNNSFKIVKTGTATIVGQSLTSGQTKTTTLAHGLSSTPASMVFVNAPSIIGLQGGAGITNTPLLYAAGATVGLLIQSRVDATNIYFDLINVGATTVDYSAYIWHFNYYLLQESAN